MGCPKCGSSSFMGKGYLGSGVCRACYDLEQILPDAKLVDPHVEARRALVQEERRLTDGICPTCGQKIRPPPLSAAERQRRYRARKK